MYFLGNVYQVRTNDQEPPNTVWMTMRDHHTHFIFKVANCRVAKLALSYNPQDTSVSTWEITIGEDAGKGQQMITIRDGINGPILNDSYPFTNLTSCSAFSEFWISWSGYHVSIGHGSHYPQTVLSEYIHRHPQHPHALHLYSESTAVWQFYSEPG